MRIRIAGLAGLLAAAAGPAGATLGEAAPLLGAPQAAMARAQAAAGGVRVVTRPTADGGMVRELVSPAGLVFEVRWNTRLKPRLDDLLGRYHAGYAAAAQATRPAATTRQVRLQATDLQVESAAHLNHFSGRAWVPSLVPAGYDPHAIP